MPNSEILENKQKEEAKLVDLLMDCGYSHEEVMLNFDKWLKLRDLMASYSSGTLEELLVLQAKINNSKKLTKDQKKRFKKLNFERAFLD